MFENLGDVMVGILGIVIAMLSAWLVAREWGWWSEKKSFLSKIQKQEENLSGKENQIAQAAKENRELHQQYIELKILSSMQKKEAEEKLQLMTNFQKQFSDSFKALSAEALTHNNRSFLDLATAKLEKFQEGAKADLHLRQKSIDDLVKPLKESLEKVNQNHLELKNSLTITHTSLSEQVKSLTTAQGMLQNETSNLVKALRAPNVRGRWGEMQLRRVVEIAGMIEHCDFVQQPSISIDDRRLRPDMIIKLPSDKQIVVDSKTPLQGYLEALEASNEELRIFHLKEHARQVRSHITQLASKSYWDQFQFSPEFVVLFLPGEPFFSAALEQDSTLIEYGVEQKVILATPTTLIALLRSVAYGWSQEVIAENAQKISFLGKELYERIHVLSEHFVDLRRGLERSIDSYNKALGSWENRVLVSARKLKEAGLTSTNDIESIEPIDKIPRLSNLPAIEP